MSAAAFAAPCALERSIRLRGMEAPDEDLMLAYRGGDAAAFDVLYRRHKGPLYRYVLRGVRASGPAEELFQDVWMRVIEARERYEPAATFRTWLYTIAHNRMMDHFRRQSLRAVDVGDDADALAEAMPAPTGAQPENLVESRADLRRLADAIAALPPAQREAFLLHQEAGLTVPEIAQATGTALEAAKSRLRYALQKLREAIDG